MVKYDKELFGFLIFGLQNFALGRNYNHVVKTLEKGELEKAYSPEIFQRAYFGPQLAMAILKLVQGIVIANQGEQENNERLVRWLLETALVYSDAEKQELPEGPTLKNTGTSLNETAQ